MRQQTLLLSREDVEKCTNVTECVTIVDSVFKAWGEGGVINPAKITLDLRSTGIDAWSNAMPAYIEMFDAAGIKWAGGYLHNPSVYGLPYVMATIILQDPRTGVPLSVMDGTYITNLRTGASAAVAAKYLARKEPATVAIVGAGAQGESSLEALATVCKVKSARVFDIDPAKSARYVSNIGKKLGIEVEACSSAEEAVNGADVIVTATTSSQPIVMNEWVKEGAIAISLGSFQEFESEFILASDKIYVDSWDQCSHRGELHTVVEKGLISRNNISGEIGEVVAGKIGGREHDWERILVVPIGLGAHDIAVAKHVFLKAREMELGRYFAFF